MQYKKRLIATFIVGLVFLFSYGCGAKVEKIKSLEIPEMGLSMRLPTGWIVDKENNRMFYQLTKRADNFGTVTEYPFQEESLTKFVEVQLKDFHQGSKSITPTVIDNLEAVEVIITEVVYSTLEVYLLKDDRVFLITFRTLRGDFPLQEPEIRKAIDSIKIKQE